MWECGALGLQGCTRKYKERRQLIEGAGPTREVEVWAEGRCVDATGYKRPIKGRRCHSAGSERRGPRSADMKTLVGTAGFVVVCVLAEFSTWREEGDGVV